MSDEQDVEEIESEKPSKATGTFCFLDFSRPCSAECSSFLPVPPDGQAYQGESWAHCHIMVSMDRVGRHISLLYHTINGMVRRAKNEADDAKRNNQQPPPKVS